MNTWWKDGRLNFRAVETMERILSSPTQTLYDLSVFQNMTALNTALKIVSVLVCRTSEEKSHMKKIQYKPQYLS